MVAPAGTVVTQGEGLPSGLQDAILGREPEDRGTEATEGRGCFRGMSRPGRLGQSGLVGESTQQ